MKMTAILSDWLILYILNLLSTASTKHSTNFPLTILCTVFILVFNTHYKHASMTAMWILNYLTAFLVRIIHILHYVETKKIKMSLHMRAPKASFQYWRNSQFNGGGVWTCNECLKLCTISVCSRYLWAEKLIILCACLV
jgi:hypothetical protein